MALKAAMWVHGSVVEAEYPSRLQSTVRKGWGTQFVGKPGTDNWFHIPITTPVILDSQRLKVAKVFVLYRSAVGTYGPVLVDVHVYDGPNKIKEFNKLGNLLGDHHAAIDQYNSWNVAPNILVHWGLGLSVHVQFQPPVTGSGSYDWLVTAAGADFVV